MKKSLKQNNLVLFTIIIFIMFIIIILLEAIIVSKKEKDNKDINDQHIKTNITKKYDTSNLEFTKITLTEERQSIKNLCIEGCNLLVSNNKNEYKYILKRNNKTLDYSLDIILSEKSIIEDKIIGNNIEELSLFKYLDTIALTTNFNGINDYVILLKDKKIDEYKSNEINELDYRDDGIVYTIKKEDKTIKEIRYPFDKKSIEIIEEN